MKHLRNPLTTSVLLVSLIATACGTGGSTPATQAPASVAAIQPSATQAPATTIPTQPAAAQPTSAPVTTATLDPTRKALDLSRTHQPGSTLANSVVEQIVFGEGYDDQQNQIVSPAFVFPVAIPKVLFGYGVTNGTQTLNFTETLKFNGEVIPLPVTKFSVPPSGAGQKQLRVKGLAVKAGVQFPVGQYQIEVYSKGQLVQQGIFDVRESAGTGVWPNRIVSRQLAAWSAAPHAQIAPDIFIVTEEDVEVLSDEVDYYDVEEIQAAYQQLEQVDELFEPFPAEVQAAIESNAQLEAEEACSAVGGVFEAASGQCWVDDTHPATACQALGGIYDLTTESCLFGEGDSDIDGWPDSVDNCPWVANVDQGDVDSNGVGDACDSDSGGDDSDGDGWPDSVDNCPFIANADQSDADADAVGDACDSDSGGDDSDGDGWPDSVDNCPFIANADQSDADADAVGDACDSDGGGNDSDGDGWADNADNCPNNANPNQEDSDSDGIGDACDSLLDSDGDGLSDASDNCPSHFNPGQEDSDSDGIGDACDSTLALQADDISIGRGLWLEQRPYSAKLDTAVAVSS